MTRVTDTAVVHLVRAGNDLNALSRFLSSYEQFSAGSSHQLVFLLKGFAPKLPSPLSKLLDRVPHSRVNCPDRGFDLGSYFFASERLTESLVMFNNSFSVLQGDRWLAKLLDAYNQPRIGVVGATGSWESLSGNYLHQRFDPIQSRFRGLLAKAKALAAGLPLLSLFPTFPNVHMRTNGFLLAREDFLKLRPRMIRTKLDAWLFESGRNSMTRQILRRGLGVLVVGRDGSVYGPDEWAQSMTFWQHQQENLLIQDNRTAAYERGNEEFRAKRSASAWNSATSGRKLAEIASRVDSFDISAGKLP
jgi:hypothetical protein